MRKLVFIVVLILFGGISNCMNAQLLWKVISPSQSNVSYILGTHHLAPKSILDSIPGLDDALENVDELYGEIDLNQVSDLNSMFGLQSLMVAPQDSLLSKVLSTDDYVALDSVWNIYMSDQFPLSLFERLKPAAIKSQLEAAVMNRFNDDFNVSDNIDLIMQQKAAKAGKSVKGLETAEMQMQLLMGAPISAQAVSLMQYVNNIDDNIKNLYDISTAYMNQDFQTISDLIELSNEEDPDTAEKLINQRNEDWIQKLEDELENHNLIIVVGAGHLPGKRGMLQLLKDKGFSVVGCNR